MSSWATCPRTTDTRWPNSKFFSVQIQIPIPNKYLGFGYKGLDFVEIVVDYMSYKKYGQGTHCTKLGADKSAKIPKIVSAKAQKFGILMKKDFIGRP